MALATGGFGVETKCEFPQGLKRMCENCAVPEGTRYFSPALPRAYAQGVSPGLVLFRPCGAWILRNHPTVPSQNQFSHRSEEHTSELQSLRHLVCRLLLE